LGRLIQTKHEWYWGWYHFFVAGVDGIDLDLRDTRVNRPLVFHFGYLYLFDVCKAKLHEVKTGKHTVKVFPGSLSIILESALRHFLGDVVLISQTKLHGQLVLQGLDDFPHTVVAVL
jgi:hypothetical protein